MEAELARVEVRVSHRSTTSTRTRTPGSGRPARGRTRRAARRSKPAAAVRLRRPRLPPPTLRVRQCPGDRLLLTEGDRRAPAATQPRRSHRHAVVPCRPGVEIPAVSEDVQVRERGGRRYPVRRHRSPRRHVPSMRRQADRRNTPLVSPAHTGAVYPLTRGRMISTGAAVCPGRTCAGTPHPAQNRRYATAYGGPGHTAAPAETGLVSGEGVA